jgi:hypothetical protein
MKELTEEENLKTEETRELMASLDKTQQELPEYQTNMVTMQIPQHGHSCSLQYKLNFSWCSLQCSLISTTITWTSYKKI